MIRSVSREDTITIPRAAALTELEGAILGVLRRAPAMTAYAVRKVFLDSRSAEWSGSAGAVYPALKRLKAAKLIASKAQKQRPGSVAFSLTPAGLEAHDEWLCDVVRAAGPGSDPFRTRAGMWRMLPAAKRKALVVALRAELAKRRDALRAQTGGDAADAVSDELHAQVQELRLRWLESQ